MNLYQYQYKDGVMTGADSHDENRQQVGVMAQELRQILPDAVHETVSQHYHTDIVYDSSAKQNWYTDIIC